MIQDVLENFMAGQSFFNRLLKGQLQVGNKAEE